MGKDSYQELFDAFEHDGSADVVHDVARQAAAAVAGVGQRRAAALEHEVGEFNLAAALVAVDFRLELDLDLHRLGHFDCPGQSVAVNGSIVKVLVPLRS